MSILSELGVKTETRYESFSKFLQEEIHTDKGLYSFSGHEIFRQLVNDLETVFKERLTDVEISLLKGAQIGASTVGIGASVFIPAQLDKNIGYFLPTDVFAKRFDQTRFKPAIRKNTFLQGLMREGKFKGADVKGLKEFRGKFLYTLGLFNIGNAISIPLDANLYDEVDILPEENMEWSDDRIAASDLRFRFFFSVGMMPGLGIDAKFQDGCQYHWHVKCPHCGKDDQILEDLFPACVQRVNGEWQRVCVRCGKAYDVEKDGRWVAHYPSRLKNRKISYRIPQLIVPAIALPYIMDRWEKAQKKKSKRAKFNCSGLAKPDGGDMQPITDAVLKACQADYRLSLSKGSLPRFAGVDCGDTAHFACYELLPNGRKRWLWFEELDSDEMVERIDTLWDELGLSGLVVDAKPLRVEARTIAYHHPEKVWLQDFKGEELTEEIGEHKGKQFQRVMVDRDDSLDEFCDLFTVEPEPLMMLPAKDADSPAILDVVDIHLKNLRKEKTVDQRGNVVFRFVKNVANHFGMAMNSAIIAEYLAVGKHFNLGPVEYKSLQHRRVKSKGAY